MTTKAAGIEQASKLRDLAVAVISQRGSWGPAYVAGKPIKVLQLTAGGFDMILSTPFQHLPCAPLSYGLDLCYKRKKVLNIWWDINGNVELLTFRRGQWETEIAAFVGTP